MTYDYYSSVSAQPAQEWVGDVQELPETSTEDRQHILDRDCWCEPTVGTVEARGHTRVKHQKETTNGAS